jgi:putative tricarboxylic transport membrane protein
VKINDAVFGAILLVLGVAVLSHVPSFPPIPGQNVGPGLFPGLVAAALCVCALLLIASGLRHRATQPWLAGGPWLRSPRRIVAFIATIAGVVGYIAFADALGFLIVAPLLLVTLLVAYGVRFGAAIVTALVVSLVMHYAFYKLLRVPLPWGVLTPFSW